MLILALLYIPPCSTLCICNCLYYFTIHKYHNTMSYSNLILLPLTVFVCQSSICQKIAIHLIDQLAPHNNVILTHQLIQSGEEDIVVQSGVEDIGISTLFLKYSICKFTHQWPRSLPRSLPLSSSFKSEEIDCVAPVSPLSRSNSTNILLLAASNRARC